MKNLIEKLYKSTCNDDSMIPGYAENCDNKIMFMCSDGSIYLGEFIEICKDSTIDDFANLVLKYCK